MSKRITLSELKIGLSAEEMEAVLTRMKRGMMGAAAVPAPVTISEVNNK